jgi:hypothetical protein
VNADLIQNLRYKLQKRVRRLNAVSWRHFHATLKQFWAFVHSQPLLVGILDEMLPRFQGLAPHVERQTSSREVIVCDDECENAAFGYLVLKRCVETTNDPMPEVRIGHNFTSVNHHDNALEAFRIAFVEPLYEYLDEQMDDQRAILALLQRYKHKCES